MKSAKIGQFYVILYGDQLIIIQFSRRKPEKIVFNYLGNEPDL